VAEDFRSRFLLFFAFWLILLSSKQSLQLALLQQQRPFLLILESMTMHF